MILHLPRLGRVMRVAATAIGAALATVGLVAQPAAALGGVMLCAFVAGGAVLRLYDRPGTDFSARRRRVIRAGGTAVWLWLIGTGLVGLLGTSTASVLVALLAVGVPAALLVPRCFRPAEPAAPALPQRAALPHAAGPSPLLDALSTPELCLAWRRSYLELSDLPAGPARGELVTLRQSMLDELERRDPAGFHRWLDAGARAGSDPGRYLATGPGA